MVGYQVLNYIKLLRVLSVETSNDEIDIHPQCFCNSCYSPQEEWLQKQVKAANQPQQSCLIHGWNRMKMVVRSDLMTSKGQGGQLKKLSSGRGRHTAIYICAYINKYTHRHTDTQKHKQTVTLHK